MATFTVQKTVDRKMDGEDGVRMTVLLSPEGVGEGHDETQDYFVATGEDQDVILQAAADHLEAGVKELIANEPPVVAV